MISGEIEVNVVFFDVFVFNVEQILLLFLVFALWTLNW